jgi:hypothetical protein
MAARAWSSRRLALVGAALVASAGLVAGGTLAMLQFSAPAQGGEMAAGTVAVVAPGSPAAPQGCQVDNLQPGTSGTCTYAVRYEGTLAGWIGLAATVINASSSNPLYGSSDGLQVQITDSYGNTFSPTTTSPPVVQLVQKVGTSDANADGSVDDGWSDTFTVTYGLPSTAPGSLKGAQATLTLQAYSVQESNDPLSCGTPVMGWGPGVASTAPGICPTVSGGQGFVTYGLSKGYWQSPGGVQQISSNGVELNTPAVIGQWPPSGGALGAQITTVAASDEVLVGGQGTGQDACTILGCPRNSVVQRGTIDSLAGQTLALAYNVAFNEGFAGETVGQLPCDQELASVGHGLNISSPMTQVLAAANAILAGSASGPTTQKQASDATQLLACLQSA